MKNSQTTPEIRLKLVHMVLFRVFYLPTPDGKVAREETKSIFWSPLWDEEMKYIGNEAESGGVVPSVLYPSHPKSAYELKPE